MKTTTKDTPKKPSPSADKSGAHDQAIENLPAVVAHMKKSNEYVKQTNQELIKMNKGQSNQNKWLRTISLLLTVFLCVLSFGLWLDHQDAKALISALAETNKRLDVVVLELKDTHQAAKDTKAVVEAQPLITVKSADPSDPSSKPVLVVQPKPTTKHSPAPSKVDAPKVFEFPVEKKK